MLNIHIIEHNCIKLIGCWKNFHQIEAKGYKITFIFKLRDDSSEHGNLFVN